jgi:hypothetical protein
LLKGGILGGEQAAAGVKASHLGPKETAELDEQEEPVISLNGLPLASQAEEPRRRF